MPRPAARAFTLIQLLVVIGMILVLIVFFLPIQRHQHEGAYRIKCSSNLRQIGLAMKMYANSETRTASYPRTVYSPDDAAHPTAYTNPNAANPFAADGPKPNDVTAALFLILRTQEITTDVFLCPGSPAVDRFVIPAGKTIQFFSNFRSQTELSYSMQNPYPSPEAKLAGFDWSDTMNADFAIMSDMNPGVDMAKSVTFASVGPQQRGANSPNHAYDGQNVLYADGHVDWSASVWAGAGQDNIYAFNAPPKVVIPTTQPVLPVGPPQQPIGLVGPPGDPFDSVMLPIWDAKVTPLPSGK